jgi:hypothetical protein
MTKLVQDNYLSATNTVWDAWTESEIRAWLIEHGYLRSDAQVEHDELVEMINAKCVSPPPILPNPFLLVLNQNINADRCRYTSAANRSAEYLTWPDARLRAYLRIHGLPESQLPTSRPGLLHEVRIRYVIAQTRVEALIQNIRDTVYGSIETAEEKLGSVLGMLSGIKDEAEVKRREAAASASSAAKAAQTKADQLKKEANKLKNEL